MKLNLLDESMIMIGRVVLFFSLTSFFQDVSKEIFFLKNQISELETRLDLISQNDDII